MNHLFHQITWHQYICSAFGATIAYYIIIGWKYYRTEIGQLIGRLSDKTTGLKKLLTGQTDQDENSGKTRTPTDGKSISPPIHPQELPFSGAANDLAWLLTDCIDTAAEAPYAPALLVPKLRKILNDHPDVAATNDREKINALVVRECEKTGTALLSESEVDQWWSA